MSSNPNLVKTSKNEEKYIWSETEFLKTLNTKFLDLIPLHEKFLQCDWLRAVVFKVNLKYLRVKITNLLRVVV